MSTKEQAQAINKSITTWVSVDTAQRAQLVIDWCAKSAIECRTSQAQLVAAMKHMPYWSQGPDSYLDVAQAISAALRVSEPFSDEPVESFVKRLALYGLAWAKRNGDVTPNGIAYRWTRIGRGRSFTILREQHHTDGDIEEARVHLDVGLDVMGVRVESMPQAEDVETMVVVDEGLSR